MIVIDTHVMICQALAPENLSSDAVRELAAAGDNDSICICDITLWEIAMLIARKRLQIDSDYQTFISLCLSAFHYIVKPITPEIAECSTTCFPESHKDPADRLIAATAICADVPLVTADKRLRMCDAVRTIW
jgi:PIN domain nuclease of toxin-antitoxin system